jgi:hypothetical protein
MPIPAIYSSTSFTLDVATETTYNSGTKGVDLGVLGIGTKFTSYELDNAWTEAYQIGQRIPQAYYTKGLQAQTALDFYLCQDQIAWLDFVLGPATGGTYTVGSTISSGMVSLGTPQGDTFTIGGIAFSTAKVNIANQMPVEVTLTGIGTSFTEASGSVTAGAIPSQLLTWKDCTLTGVSSSLIQSLNFTIDTGASLYYALGSALYQAYLPLQSKITCEITAFHQDAAIDDLYQLISEGTVTVAVGTHTVTFLNTYLTKGTLGLEPVKEATNVIDFSAIQMTIV